MLGERRTARSIGLQQRKSYFDILMHDYSKDEPLAKCGTADCVNVTREEGYKHSHTTLLGVDHEGEWQKVHSVSLGLIER